MLRRLNILVYTASASIPKNIHAKIEFDSEAKTAAIFVNGFNGLGLHTLMAVIKNFGKEFRNFVFIEAGIIDAGNFKGAQEVDRLKESVQKNLQIAGAR